MISTKECIFCKDNIAVNSKKCPRCGQLQSGNKNYFIALGAVLVFDILVLVLGSGIFHNPYGRFNPISALPTNRGSSQKLTVSEDLIAMYEGMGYARKDAIKLLSSSQEIADSLMQGLSGSIGNPDNSVNTSTKIPSKNNDNGAESSSGLFGGLFGKNDSETENQTEQKRTVKTKSSDISEEMIALYEALGYSREDAIRLLSASLEIGGAVSQGMYDSLGITEEDATQLATSVLDSMWNDDDSVNTASDSSQKTSNSSKYNIAYNTIPRDSFAVLEKMLVGNNFWDLLDTDGSFMNPAVYLLNWTSNKNINPVTSIPKNAKKPSSCTLEEIYLNLYLRAAAEEITPYTDDFSYSSQYLPWEYSAYSIITELKKNQKVLDHFIDSYILFAYQGVSPDDIRAVYADFDQYAAMHSIDDILQLNFGFDTKNLPVWWLSTKRKFLTSDCL